jgi:hypothetical protein
MCQELLEPPRIESPDQSLAFADCVSVDLTIPTHRIPTNLSPGDLGNASDRTPLVGRTESRS